MTQTLISGCIILIVLSMLVVRQVRWRALRDQRPVLPLVLLGTGLILTIAAIVRIGLAEIAPANWLLLVVELGLGALAGWLIGRVATFRDGPAGVESRGGWRGASVWIGLVAVRLALMPLALHLGATTDMSTGTVLLAIGLARFLADHILRVEAGPREGLVAQPAS